MDGYRQYIGKYCMTTLALVEQLIQLLTLEVVECVHWRVGALLYMYCHTIRGKPERVEKEWNVLLKVRTLYAIGNKTFLLFVGFIYNTGKSFMV